MAETVAPDVIPGMDVDGDSSNPADDSAVTEVADQQVDEENSGEETQEDEGLQYGVRKRIDKLTWEREEARRQEAHWKNVAMQGQVQTRPPQNPNPVPTGPVGPQAENFNTYEEYQRELVRYEARLESSRLMQEQRMVDAAMWKQSQVDNSFHSQCETVNAEHPDFGIAFRQPHEGGPVVNDVMAMVIKESDVGAKVLYHLAKNPAESKRIASLPGTMAIKEIGRIEARYVAASSGSPPRKQVTQAPAPIKSSSGSGSISSVDGDKMPIDDWIRDRNNTRR